MKRPFAAAGIFFAIFLIAALWWFGKTRADQAMRSAAAQTSQAAVIRKPKIRVGVYLSAYCASGAEGTQWVYGHSCQMAGELHDDALKVIPLIEPGTETVGDLPKLLDHFFPGAVPADVTQIDVLKSFDVIVIPRINYLRDDVRQNIESAVRNGTGLLIRNTFGNGVPGYTPEMARLNGFEAADFTYNPHAVDCEVLADHPILGSLHKGDVIKITPNGAMGKLLPGSVPLIRVKDIQDVGGDATNPYAFYPLFLTQLDKGRIAQCVFPAWSPTPVALQKATGGRFNVRVIQWLAKKPVE